MLLETRRQGLGEPALLRRLGRPDHLVLSRGLLLDLLAGLRGRNDVTLAAWECWPLRLPGATLGGRRDLFLDGAGVLALGGRGEDHEGWASFVLLWDDAQVAIEALRPRLRALLQVGSTRAVLAADPAGVPAVLCAVASAGRTRAVHRLARDLARGLDVPPLTLLTADQRDLITSGPLGVPWCGADRRERDLLVALPRQHVSCPGVLALAALRAHPRHAHPLVGVTTGPRRGTGGMAQEEPRRCRAWDKPLDTGSLRAMITLPLEGGRRACEPADELTSQHRGATTAGSATPCMRAALPWTS